jgi:pimeloyl-ACP methyl ester carboxylesterase
MPHQDEEQERFVQRGRAEAPLTASRALPQNPQREVGVEAVPVRKTVRNGGVGIEYFVSGAPEAGQAGLVVSMGNWEPAFRAWPLMERLPGRHVVALSYRGRGGSGTPATGFDWTHHASDLAAVLAAEPVAKPVFLAFSKGVSYTLGYLSMCPAGARGLILVDQPAIHSAPEPGYARFWMNRVNDGLRFCDHTTPATWEGIERESTFRDFYDDLKRLDVPVWLFRGRDAASAIPSDLTDEDVGRYRESIRALEVIDFPDSGHMVLTESLGQAARETRRILALVDAVA